MGVREIGCNYLGYSPLKTWLWFLLLLKVGQIDTTVFGSNLKTLCWGHFNPSKIIDNWIFLQIHWFLRQNRPLLYSQISLENTILFQKEKKISWLMYVYLALVSICMYNKENFFCLTEFLFPSKSLEWFAKEKIVDLKHGIGTEIYDRRDSWI